jgi:hypothetical protein
VAGPRGHVYENLSARLMSQFVISKRLYSVDVELRFLDLGSEAYAAAFGCRRIHQLSNG